MTNNFQPNWASPLRETVNLLASINSLERQDLCRSLQINEFELDEILDGVVDLSISHAEYFSTSLGGSIDFWLNRAKIYKTDQENLRAQKENEDIISWCKNFPISELKKRGWICTKKPLAESLFHFFNIKKIEEWDTITNKKSIAFRKANSSDIYATHAWIQEASNRILKNDAIAYNKKNLPTISQEIRELTRLSVNEDTISAIKGLLAKCGIYFIVLPALPGSKVSGVLKIIGKDSLLLLLSDRYKTNDHFWFTLFHEIGHALLHFNGETIFDYEDMTDSFSNFEIEANNFAESILIPQTYQNELHHLKDNYRSILKFAKKIGIAPGIVVGQMQHKGLIPRSYLNKLKEKIQLIP